MNRVHNTQGLVDFVKRRGKIVAKSNSFELRHGSLINAELGSHTRPQEQESTNLIPQGHFADAILRNIGAIKTIDAIDAKNPLL